MIRDRALLVVAAALLAAGCGGGEQPTEEPAASPREIVPTDVVPTTAGPTACEATVQAAATGGEDQDTQADVWPAFEACGTVEEFANAVQEFGGARFEGVDPETYVQDQCRSEPQVEGTALCQSL